MKITIEAIVTTVCVLVACFIALGLYLVISKHSQKRESLSRLLALDEEFRKVDARSLKPPKFINALTYDKKLFETQIELPFPMLRLEKTVTLVQNYLDFSKQKNLPPIEPQKLTIKLNKDELSYEHEHVVTNIKYKDIFYLKGYYEHRRNAIFISFVEYNYEHKLPIQITNIKDLINLSNVIKESR